MMLAGPAAHAGRSDPALRADIPNLHELVERARTDVHLHETGISTRDQRRKIDRTVRENAQRRLRHHLVNLSGHPHFDAIWTHYVVEGRRSVSPGSRQYHVRACPICNVALHELGNGSGVALPKLVVPFATVTLGDAYFKVDPASGRIYRIVDPIRGTPSFVSTGRMMLSNGRWWVVNGTQRTGPILTRESTRLPWALGSNDGTPGQGERQPSRREAAPQLRQRSQPAPARPPSAAAATRPSAPSSAHALPPGWPNASSPAIPPDWPQPQASSTPPGRTAPSARPEQPTRPTAPSPTAPAARAMPQIPADWPQPDSARPSAPPAAQAVPQIPADWPRTGSARSSTPPIPLSRATPQPAPGESADANADSSTAEPESGSPSGTKTHKPFWR